MTREPVRLLSLTLATGIVRRYVGRKLTGRLRASGICAAAAGTIESLRINGWPPVVTVPKGENE